MFGRTGEVTDAIVHLKPTRPAFYFILRTIRRFAFWLFLDLGDVGDNRFLAHLSRRLEWAIVIAHRLSSIRPSVRPSVVVRKLFTFSTFSPEALDGFWLNLVGMTYSWSLTSVVVFRPDLPRADPGWGQNRSKGVPFFKRLLLQTRRLQQQTKWIAMI